MATGDRIDPYAQFNFVIEVDGVARAGFSECSGLDTETTPIEYREGNEPATVRKLPGLHKYTNLVLKRGYTQDKDLWNWRKTVLDGATSRRAGSVILRGENGQEVLRWNFREGWPTKWTGPQLNAKTTEVAIETLEIAHEGIELA